MTKEQAREKMEEIYIKDIEQTIEQIGILSENIYMDRIGLSRVVDKLHEVEDYMEKRISLQRELEEIEQGIEVGSERWDEVTNYGEW